MREAISFPAPDYQMMESLVQNLLEQMRVANIMIAACEDEAAIVTVLKAAQAAHGRLVLAMNRDALNAHAAGHIYTALLGDRLAMLRNLTVEIQTQAPSVPPLAATEVNGKDSSLLR
jgi:hypothetical protein